MAAVFAQNFSTKDIATPASRKIAQIQQLRGFAVILTVLAHEPLATGLWSMVGLSAPYWIGVIIFYGVSGYIIFSTTEQSNWSGLTAFYVRRLMRIAPILIATLTVALFASVALPHQLPFVNQFYAPPFEMTRAASAQILFLGNFTPFLGIVTPICILGLWSISVEAHFYFAFGATLFLSPSRRAAALVVTAALVFLVKICLFRSIMTAHTFYYEVLLVAGAACFLRDKIKPSLPGFAITGAYILSFPLLPKAFHFFVFSYPILTLAVAYFVVCAGHGLGLARSGSALDRILLWTGERSYVIYVLHFQVLAVAGLVLQMGGLNFSHPLTYNVLLMLAMLAALPVFEFFHKLIEVPGIAAGRQMIVKLKLAPQGSAH